MNSKTLTVLVSCLFPLVARSAEVAGNVYAAQDGQGLAGAIVYVVSGIRPGTEPTNRAAAEFAVRGGRLVPEVFVVRTGETFVVKNADATPYNVQFQFRENKNANLALIPGGQITTRADRPELFARISEDLHRLRGYICVIEHSFYALTDVAGAFDLPNLPAGSYMIEAVHPRQGRLRKEITVTEKKSSVEFMLPGRSRAPFVEISAEIETFGYRLGDTNSIANAKPRTVSLICVTGSNRWYMTNNFQLPEQWLFDGTNVWCRTETPNLTGSSVRNEVWESRDGHPLGHFGVNLSWLAFCSGTYLKREGRLIPLPAAILRHCPDRFAYTDVATTFADELGLPKSIDLFSSQALFLKSHTDWDKELSFGNRYTEWNQKTALKIQDGLLVFHYAVLESTNVLGQSFPTKFEFFQTGRPYEQMGNWFCQGVGWVKCIRPAATLPSLK